MIIADVFPSIEFWRLALGAGIASLILVSLFVWCAMRLGVVSDERADRFPPASVRRLRTLADDGDPDAAASLAAEQTQLDDDLFWDQAERQLRRANRDGGAL